MKLTDEEIIKALECCQIDECEECPANEVDECTQYIRFCAIDLINRQKAEIERLQNSLAIANKEIKRYVRPRKEVVNEAYKEFIEWLQANGHINFSPDKRLNLLKEMAGGE